MSEEEDEAHTQGILLQAVTAQLQVRCHKQSMGASETGMAKLTRTAPRELLVRKR